jgi:hypothetical protein
VGNPAASLPPEADDAFAAELAFRLQAQWPAERFDAGRVRAWMRETLSALAADGGPPGAFPDVQAFHAAFLARVRRSHPAVNPWYYDLQAGLVERWCPDAPLPDGPPSPVVLEEPPFVTVSPWRTPAAHEVEARPLVVKTPSNAYRLPFLRALFPSARIRVLHLVRNAAASINGLHDGWRFRGFHAHFLPSRLAMAGYSDIRAGGTDWWKFDLPPGWEAWTGRPLVEVCGFQWRRAHEATLAFLEDPSVDRLRVRFEDVTGGRRTRRAAFEAIFSWLDVPLDGAFASLVERDLPPVMATARPRQRRWFERADLLEPVLADPATVEVLDRLGYDPDPATWT